MGLLLHLFVSAEAWEAMQAHRVDVGMRGTDLLCERPHQRLHSEHHDHIKVSQASRPQVAIVEAYATGETLAPRLEPTDEHQSPVELDPLGSRETLVPHSSKDHLPGAAAQIHKGPPPRRLRQDLAQPGKALPPAGHWRVHVRQGPGDGNRHEGIQHHAEGAEPQAEADHHRLTQGASWARPLACGASVLVSHGARRRDSRLGSGTGRGYSAVL
eukprot:scaffold1435_cov267-Pinguiococcus_pyrenoidosus.AAC.24